MDPHVCSPCSQPASKSRTVPTLTINEVKATVRSMGSEKETNVEKFHDHFVFSMNRLLHWSMMHLIRKVIVASWNRITFYMDI